MCFLGAFPGFAKQVSGNSKKCAGKDEQCGGIAGIICCPGLSCKYDGNHPDAAGICVDAETGDERSQLHVWPDESKEPCVHEGGSIPVIPNASSCCKGLTRIKPKDEKNVGSSGICTSKCGDGVCAPASETAYNCPRDCKPADNPFTRKVWDKYHYPADAPGWEGTDWHNALTIKEDEGQVYGMYLYQFMKTDRPVYVGWLSCFNVMECSRVKIYTGVEVNFGGNMKRIKITKAVPKQHNGKAVFESEIKNVNDGKAILYLQEVPVFIEAE